VTNTFHQKLPNRDAGFTLVELAISMFIIALLLGSILVPLTTQVEQRQVSETQKTLDEVREALLGFAVANGYLPCPDVTAGTGANDGFEDVTAATGVCQVLSGTIATGNLPWATLGLGNQDSWGNRFRYTVLANFAQRTPATPFSITTAATTLRVCSSQACTSITTSAAVAVIVSHGNNGLGAINAATNTAHPAPTSVDEIENTDTDLDTVSRVRSTVAGSEFDDVVVWLPKFTLINRMVAAEKLP
jgi:prepilin-type N-terminal cleavage/methylation domain-containing protein